MKPSLLILAAGMGSRYGGAKQIDSVDSAGACLFDYTLYDARKAGFGKVVFLITKKMEDRFRDSLSSKYTSGMDLQFAFQELDTIPGDLVLPDARTSPWGTGHAILSAKDLMTEPFAVINADDYYGPSSYALMHDSLKAMKNDSREFSMAGFRLINTLSPHGGVSRGICNTSDGFLSSVVERKNIRHENEEIVFTDHDASGCTLSPGSIVSMNFWGFAPDTIFPLLEERFDLFIRQHINDPKAELYIPEVIDHAIKNGRIRVRMLESEESWFGMTYAADLDTVKAAIRRKVDAKIYPENLFLNKSARTL